MTAVSETTTVAERTPCTNLNQAQAGQWVKVGSTKSGVNRVAEIVAVHKNGNVKLDKFSVFKPEPRGDRAYKTGERNRIGGYTVMTPFAEGETVQGVVDAIAGAQDAEHAEREARDAAREREAQAKIEAACIVHSNGRDVPGSKVARWFDSRGNARITLYFAKVEQMYGAIGYRCQIADFENGFFGSSTCASTVSVEDAVNRWIAACYGQLAE